MSHYKINSYRPKYNGLKPIMKELPNSIRSS